MKKTKRLVTIGWYCIQCSTLCPRTQKFAIKDEWFFLFLNCILHFIRPGFETTVYLYRLFVSVYLYRMHCSRSRVYLLCAFFFFQVKVKILDRNDNRPAWPSAPIEYEISEEIPIGSLVATLRATDADLDSTLTYAIVTADDDGNEHSPLTVDAHTGSVRVRRPVDRESSPRIVLPVRVSDGVHSSETSAVFIVST